MRYFKVTFIQDGVRIFSDPLTTWIDARKYADAIGIGADILRY